MLVAPASADFIAKLAHGRADDLLSLLCLARPIERCPLLVAPAMNREMWAHPATQRNFARSSSPTARPCSARAAATRPAARSATAACSRPASCCDELIAFFQPKLLAGKRVLVTAGPTFEPIDPVRGITNRSSGKMGFAIARAAAEAGADVTLVAGPVALDTPRRVRRIDVTTARRDARRGDGRGAARSDVFVATAAVADWRVADAADAEDQEGRGQAARRRFELVENPDILATVAALPKAPFCVGFAAESNDLLGQCAARSARRSVPLIVGNLGPGDLRPRRQRAHAGRRDAASASCRAPTSSRWRAAWSPRSRRASGRATAMSRRHRP